MSGFSNTDSFFMRRALRCACAGLRSSDPNPAVGAVVVSCEGEKIAEGCHKISGSEHAEVIALNHAGSRAKGATLYVNLEPCNHKGRTGACAQRIIKAQIRRVVIAGRDPNPIAKGGIHTLKDAGIEVKVGVCAKDHEHLNRGFLSRMRRKRPWIQLKIAASLDGAIAFERGIRSKITGEMAAASVQRLRARSSVIITGSKTAMIDNPRLNVRLKGAKRQPQIVVVKGKDELELGTNLKHNDKVMLAVPRASKKDITTNAKAGVLTCDSDHKGRVDLKDLTHRLAELGCNLALIEAGPTLASSFLAEGLVDECLIYYAPFFSSGTGHAMIDATIAKERCDFKVESVMKIGADVRIQLLNKNANIGY